MSARLLCPQLALPSIQYTEQCRLVRSGDKHFDEHCLPTTVHGEMEGILNRSRVDTFLVYLQCWKVCEAHGLPLTEDTLMRGTGLGVPWEGAKGGPEPWARVAAT